jgi:hypothetical protein
MKFHGTLIEKLVKVMEVNSGWRDEKKLKEALASMNLVVYTQKSGNQVLVDADEMARLQGNR